MTIALALLAVAIVVLFSGLVLGALRRQIPEKSTETVWINSR